MSVRMPPLHVGAGEDLLGELPLSISAERLREALAGRDPAIRREHAIGLVLSSNLPDKVDLLRSVLQALDATPEARRLAAVQLGHLDQQDARAALLEALGEQDERVLGGVVKALGWIGTSDAYEPLLAIRQRASPKLAGQAEFAARLIAHRHGLEGTDLPPLRVPEALELPAAARRPVEVAQVSPDRARLCLESIATRSFALRFDTEHLYQLRCDRDEWILVFHRNLLDDAAPFLRHRSIAAAIALWIAESRTYSIAFLALFEPAVVAGSDRLVVCRSTGEPIFAGDCRIEGDRVLFSIWAVVRPGAFPVLFEGSFRAGTLSVDVALSGPVVVPKRRPIPLR